MIEKFGLTDYAYNKAYQAFFKSGTIGLIGLDSLQLIEELPVEIERRVFVLKATRAWIPATKMVLILKGFNNDVSLELMRHLYASYGWAQGTKPYKDIDFQALNLKITHLNELQSSKHPRKKFIDGADRLQQLLEVFRTLGTRGITKRYPGSRMSLA